MAKRKAQPRKRTASTKLRARKTSSRVRRESAARGISRFGLPLILSAILIACLAVFGYSVYDNATGSHFFDVRRIEVRGIDRTSEDNIRRVIAAEAEKPGVWKADLGEIKVKVEKFPFVRSASVSRLLPAGIRVDVIERIPVAVVQLTYGDYLVDGEGTLLT
ncbi:MAG: FtsQ-type POTRA domain-containing protein, partial [Pyrinomonadaceae bacterium]